MKDLKNKTVEVKTSTLQIVKSFTELIEALSLLGLTVYGLYGAYHYSRNEPYVYPLLFAALVVGLLGSVQFVKHLNKN